MAYGNGMLTPFSARLGTDAQNIEVLRNKLRQAITVGRGDPIETVIEQVCEDA